MTLARRFRNGLAALALAWGATAAAQTVDVVLTNSLVEPHSLTTDSAGTLYITDQGGLSFGGLSFGGQPSANRVVKFVPTTSSLTFLAGDPAGSNGTNDNPTANAGFTARFFNPAGIVLARGGLVVADSGNHTIRYVGFNGVVSNIAGAPTVSALVNGAGSAARFNTPLGLAADSAGNIYVADSKNNVIRKIDPANTVTTYATNFNQPNGVAVGDNGDLWVADTLNHQIKTVRTNNPAPDGIFTNVLVRAGTGTAGSADTFPIAATAQLSFPRGLVWMGVAGLLITDSGNHTVRRLYTNSTVGTYTIETSAGAAGQAGFVNGATNVARLNSPIGLVADVLNGAFLVADQGNKAIRRIQQTPAQPAIGNPTIGTVELRTDPQTGQTGTVLSGVTSSVFNNDVVIAILAETGVNTYFSAGTTPTNAFNDTVPAPGPGTGSAPAYRDGASALPATLINPVLPDITIKAQSSQNGRISSGTVSARFQFQTANPTISGNNAAAFTVNNITSGAQMYYTLDGTEPTNGAPSIGPITTGTTLSFNLNNSNLVFTVKAFKGNYSPSSTISNIFSPSNFVANRIAFGFDGGEASSSFIAASGQTYFAPVTMNLLSGQKMYSLQFALSVTNGTGPALTAGAVAFDSRLRELLPDGTYRRIPPAMFTSFTTNIVAGVTNISQNFTNLLTTNSTLNLLSVGWLERLGQTNLYATTSQDLIKYSLAHDNVFDSANAKVVVGAFGFRVPTTATNGQTYTIRIHRPSATADGIATDVFIDAPTNGSLTVASPINAVKTVTIGSPIYLAGDTAPFRWVNAGDFGDTNLLANDVAQIFQTAVYGFNSPVAGSDFEDAMDSCCGSVVAVPGTTLFVQGPNVGGSLSSGDDTVINTIGFGDGTLDVADVFVTFRRSLDASLTNFFRFRSNGFHYAFVGSNTFRGVSGQSVTRSGSSSTRGSLVAQSISTPADASSVTFSAGEIVGGAGQTLNIPVTARVSGTAALRVLMLNLTVVPLEGSPALTSPVLFTPDGALGTPTISQARGPGNYSAAWLNNTISGLAGDAQVGTLVVTLPAGAGANSAYAVRFDHASASPTGVGTVPARREAGLITTRARNTSSWGDNIPDSWRLKHFGALNNLLSAPNADADGDGIPNWAEFRAGTDPNDAGSGLQLHAPGLIAGGPRLRWPTVAGKSYVLEVSPSIAGTNWTVVATNVIGSGREIEFQTPPPAGPQFYRVRLAEP